MCGIAGYIRFGGLHAHERDLGPRMAATLRHRGPDDTGAHVDRCASLGHARLSVIDLDNGRQPICNESGDIWVLLNGEIYNYRELAEECRSRGHHLRSQSDTEVIVHLYEEFGEAFVDRLSGMFAVAIWDFPKRKLLLVRDRLGIKPLYWRPRDGSIAFGSEMKSVLVAGGENRVDLCALTDYFTFGHVPAPRTIFNGIRKLDPGCMLVCTPSSVSLRSYWDIPFRDDAAPGDPGECIDAFEAALEHAVGEQMDADVPLGAFLSGGVDSAAVTAGMRRCRSGPILTHTVGFDEQGHDERAPARRTADALRADHYETLVRADGCALIEKLAWHYDEPFADASAIPTYHLSKAARGRVTVALSGDGGDELLAGYRRYRFDLVEAALRSVMPGPVRRPIFFALGGAYPSGERLPRMLRARATLLNLAHDDATAHLRSVALSGGSLPHLLLRPEVLEQGGYDPFDHGRDLYARCGSRDRLNKLLYMDLKTLLPDDMLTKVDRASMAVGLEVRVPLLDHRLVELSARLPACMKLCRGEGKVVLRRVVERWLGPDFARRPKKGFDIPLDAWLSGPMREFAGDFLAPGARIEEWVDRRVVNRLLVEHNNGHRAHGRTLWTLLTLEQWARTHLTSVSSIDDPDPCDIFESQAAGRAPASPVGVS